LNVLFIPLALSLITMNSYAKNQENKKIEIAIIKTVDSSEDDEFFTFVDTHPQFPGGENALAEWLSENLVYPQVAKDQGIQGTVNIRFVVEVDGSIAHIEVLKPLDPSCDKEAIRAINAMPKWIPGKQGDKNVAVYYNLPVRFRIAKKEKQVER
jgi:TonB family C-terminal domain